MLRFLAIEHVAVIDRLRVELGPGLTVLTGETGAGKSMLVESVGLLLGGRAATDLVRTGEPTATVQAVVERPDGTELVIRRELTAQGRSRAFIDDALVTAAALKASLAPLIEIHGQHEHQTLLDPESHLSLLDAQPGPAPLTAAVATAFEAWAAARDELALVRREQADFERRRDLLAFELADIAKVAPAPNEDEALQQARQVLANADRLERLCTEGYSLLYERDESLLAGLGLVWKRLVDLAAVDTRFQPYLEARDGIKGQLEDLAQFLREYADGLDASPARLQEVEQRLAALERLKRKYGPTLADVIARGETARQALASIEGAGDRLAALTRASDRARQAYLGAATELSAARRKAAGPFARAIEALVGELAMTGTRLEMRFDETLPEGQWGRTGLDRAELFVSPNAGEDLRPLARIVSGGELSRLMLAIKTLAAADLPGATLIFDEVDAGIGGQVAHVVGRRLRALGRRHQVLCITHLPQIAAQADAQFRIEKHIRAGRTVTSIEPVTGEARVEELSRMLGGEVASDAGRATARAMLDAAGGESEAQSKGESERAKAKGAHAETRRVRRTEKDN
ncbi:MAG TPA: DNA repair protein RecN [Vicinamibacterales bacterium]